ncbi:hypothetical protein CKM354_000215200 [Cercospora kikuchii]|uniref:Uncharacterized protein n=1 Tax=Cercospora kikuchii TaxID=84275 RepID=A0A9P3F9C8_9PEZI|nr:uncharacterized protein CKM354_000215200 [Cercospora kikuchii]GIZ38748.1 hypothetical protein CKM354_000215200 [Cercospora kikuchii]
MPDTTPQPAHGLAALNSWGISLDTAGLVALADLSSILRRCALTGTSSILDAFVIAPGLHRQYKAGDFGINQGEIPEAVSLDSGHVFHIHNPATVMFFQDMSETGQLTEFIVEPLNPPKPGWQEKLVKIFDFREESMMSLIFYALAVVLSWATILATAIFEDWFAFWGVLALIFARALNVYTMRRRAHSPGADGWFGNKYERGKRDIFVLLSRDRWVRLKGNVEDMKRVTAGTWLDKPQPHENWLVSLATLIVFGDAVVINNAQNVGKVLLISLLLITAILLALVNDRTSCLKMHGRVVRRVSAVGYEFRLDMVKALKRDVGQHDWAQNLRMLSDGDLARIL